MSHISEGLLHARLDGAVGHDRAEEWLSAEAHLSVCEDCRRRLDEARQLRAAAGEILAVASVPMASKPDFDELMAQAGNAAPQPRRKPWWNSTARLAWAASLMLAVGAGWLGRELLIQTGQDMPAVVAESEALPQAPEQTEGFRDAVEQDDSAAEEGQARVGAGDADLVSGERAARRMAEQPADEPEVALMQKSEGKKAAEESRQDAESKDARVDRLEAVAERENETDTMARAVRGGGTLPTCFVAEEGLDSAPLPAPQELQLLADGTAVASAGETQMVGTWVEGSGDSVQVLLGSGDFGTEMRLERAATGLSGTFTFAQGAGDEAAVDADAAAVSPSVLIRLRTVDCETAR